MTSTVDIAVVCGDGHRLIARRAGRGQPLVLVHGSAGGLDSWDTVLPYVHGRFECWTYARRGYVPSDVPHEIKTMADEVRDLTALVALVRDETGQQPILVGGSYGALVLLALAAGDSSSVPGMALFEPPLFACGASSRRVLGEYRSLIDDQRYTAAARLFAEQVARMPAELLDAGGITDREPSSASADDLRNASAEAIAVLHDLEAMADSEIDPGEWSAVSCPVFLLQGELTWEPMPAAMADLAAHLPAERLTRVVLEGQTHFATHTAPKQFAEAVRRSLADSRQ